MDQSKEAAYMKRRKEVEEIVEDRFELQRKALKIVERLTEIDIDEDFFRCCAEFILPSHYSDVVEERSIDWTCGYPLCDNSVEKMPAQKYHISMKSNKVYDMTERKCFCSHFCYRASRYYQAQIPTVPLWSRSKERFDEVKLLKKDTGALPGNEEPPPDSLIVRLRVKEEEIEHPPPKEESDDAGNHLHREDGEDHLVEDISILSLRDTRTQKKRYSEYEREEAKREAEKKAGMLVQKVSESGRNVANDDDGDSGKNITTCNTTAEREGGYSRKVKNGANVEESEGNLTVGSNLSEGDMAMRNRELKGKDLRPQAKVKQDDSSPSGKGEGGAEFIFKCIQEWRTAQSAKFLRKCYECMSDGNQKAEVRVEVSQGTNNVSDKLLGNGDGLSQKLTKTEGMPEGDLVDDSKLDGHEDARNKGGVVSFAATKPVPDADTLRQETERFALKVKQFYAIRPDKLLPADKEVKSKKTKTRSAAGETDESMVPISLPPVDSHSQMTIRRKILLDKVHKVYRGLLSPLNITLPDISGDLRDLVRTFNLHSNNISFKPAGWTLVSLCLLHLLAHRQSALHEKLTSPGARAFLTALWKQYGITGGDVGNFVEEFVGNEP